MAPASCCLSSSQVSPVGSAGFLGAPEAPDVAVASTRTFTTMVALKATQLRDSGQRLVATVALLRALRSSSRRCLFGALLSVVSSVAAS